MRPHDGGQSQKRMSISLSVYGLAMLTPAGTGQPKPLALVMGVWHQVTAALSHDRYTVLVGLLARPVTGNGASPQLS